MRQETSTGNVFAGLVCLNAVGLKKIIGYRSEIISMSGLRNVNFDNPLQAIARWRAEKQLRVKILIFQKLRAKRIKVLQMVEVNAQQARMIDEGFICASGKCTAECAIVEVGSLEHTRLFGIAKRA